jgi:hypothetical protein
MNARSQLVSPVPFGEDGTEATQFVLSPMFRIALTER